MLIEARSFLVIESKLRDAMIDQGRSVHTETWQGMDISSMPAGAMFELLNVTTSLNLRRIEQLEHWRAELRPNLPWADDHFLERVGGVPLNPPPSWAWWPWAKSADKFRAAEKFNHTYPERYWPKLAGHEVPSPYREDGTHKHGGEMFADSVQYATSNRGIRGEYGDLADVVQLLREQPLTRQAYLPIFFPEDTGVGDGGRKPCTLGYHFIMRENLLHCYYPMRSCDFVRHYRDDVYLTVRLMLWVLEQLRGSAPWDAVMPGSLTMHTTSLHLFVNDMITLRKERDAAIAGALS